MTLHMGCYWYRVIIEDKRVCSELAMMSLRKLIYEMVLDDNQDFVVEYGRSYLCDWNPLQVITKFCNTYSHTCARVYLYVYVCVCMHVSICVCMCVCGVYSTRIYVCI